MMFCVGIECASILIQTTNQSCCLKHTDVKICLVIRLKYMCPYHFHTFAEVRKKLSWNFVYLLFARAQNLKCSLFKMLIIKRKNPQIQWKTITSPMFFLCPWHKIALGAPKVKEVNIHLQEWSSKCIPCLSLAQLARILIAGNFLLRDAEHVRKEYLFFLSINYNNSMTERYINESFIFQYWCIYISANFAGIISKYRPELRHQLWACW